MPEILLNCSRKLFNNGLARKLGKQPQPIKMKLIKIQHVLARERWSSRVVGHKPSHKTVNSPRSHQKYCNTFCLLIVGRGRGTVRGERKFPDKTITRRACYLLNSSWPPQPPPKVFFIMKFCNIEASIHGRPQIHSQAHSNSQIHRYSYRYSYTSRRCISQLCVVALIMKMPTVNSFVY